MNDNLPTLFSQEFEVLSDYEVVKTIYLLNGTDRNIIAKASAGFFQTIDDDSGQTLEHGSDAAEVILAPGQWTQVGNVLGWELDSALMFDIEFRHAGENNWRKLAYDLRLYDQKHEVDGLGEVYEIKPRVIWPPLKSR